MTTNKEPTQEALSQALSYVARQRKVHELTCKFCGGKMEGYATKQFCSKSCRQRSYWAENKDRYNPLRRKDNAQAQGYK